MEEIKEKIREPIFFVIAKTRSKTGTRTFDNKRKTMYPTKINSNTESFRFFISVTLLWRTKMKINNQYKIVKKIAVSLTFFFILILNPVGIF